ncbi:hypothetical protein HZB07_03035 [Candidatus Saganbacteria bacterium]|nr:hypothetical protein [Candidatus Saganbacteria bacterium]
MQSSVQGWWLTFALFRLRRTGLHKLLSAHPSFPSSGLILAKDSQRRQPIEYFSCHDYNDSILGKKSCLILISLLVFFSLANLAGADIGEYSKNIESDYGPEYFFAIEGDVSGQAAPGVQSVRVNGRPITINSDLTFYVHVSLRKGEKYLTIETRYKNLNFTKKYLVIRHPKAPKSFKIDLPQQEFKKIISPRRPNQKRYLPRRKTKPQPSAKAIITALRAKERPPANWLGFEYVAELESGRFLIVRHVGSKYYAAIYLLKNSYWIPLQEISYNELVNLLDNDIVPLFIREKK